MQTLICSTKCILVILKRIGIYKQWMAVHTAYVLKCDSMDIFYTEISNSLSYLGFLISMIRPTLLIIL